MEKIDIIVWIVVIIFVVVILYFILSFRNLGEIPSIVEIKICEIDADCIRVTGACCGCPVSVNKIYVSEWERLLRKTDCSNIQCSMCGPGNPLGIECKNNTCSVIWG